MLGNTTVWLLYKTSLHPNAWVVRRDNRYYYRRRVPGSGKAIVGKGKIWRSPDTDDLSLARRRCRRIAALVEHDFEVVRQQAGMAIDDYLIMETIGPVVASMAELQPVMIGSVKAGSTPGGA